MLIKQHASDDLNSSNWSVSVGFAEKRMKAEIREINSQKEAHFRSVLFQKAQLKKVSYLCVKDVVLTSEMNSHVPDDWRYFSVCSVCRQQNGVPVFISNCAGNDEVKRWHIKTFFYIALKLKININLFIICVFGCNFIEKF